MAATAQPAHHTAPPEREAVVYFDNGATSWPKPPAVAEAMRRFLEHDAANPGRSAHRMAARSQALRDALRARLAALLGAESPERLVLTSGCTEALNIAIHGLFLARAPGGARPRAVTTVLEHNAVTRPLADLEGRGLIDVETIGCDSDGFVAADRVLDAVDQRTLLVAVTHASNAIGTIQPVDEIGRRLRAEKPHALLLVDAAQSAGVVPIDVRAMCVDMLAFAGHKGLLGPTGVGGLYIGPRAYSEADETPRIATVRQGGTGGGGVTTAMPTALPRRFEPGTPNTVGFAGMIAALDHVPTGALAHERRHAERIIRHAAGLPGVRLLGAPDVSRRTGVVTLTFEGRNPKDVARLLDERYGIACRAGGHCAPFAHLAMGTGEDGGVRFGPGPFTTDADVDLLLRALTETAAGSPAAARPAATAPPR